MLFGVIPAHGPDNVDEAIRQVKLCDQKFDIDSIWIEEHHAAGPYWPTPLVALATLAPYTERVLMGTNILILPLYDPVHVAEDFAVLDQITNGRMVLAVALGDSAQEFAMFRVQAKHRGSVFEEQVQIIRALWTEAEVSFRGDYFNYDEIHLSTKPVQEGGPAIWIGGWGPLQLGRAAHLADAWIPGPVASMDAVLERMEVYRDKLKARDGDPNTRTQPLTRDVIVQARSEDAWELAEKDLLPAYYESYLDSDHPLVGKGSGTRFEDLRSLARDRFIIGEPDTIIEEVLKCIRTTHADHFIFRTKLPGVSPTAITGIIEIIGEEVVPALRIELSEAKSESRQETESSE